MLHCAMGLRSSEIIEHSLPTQFSTFKKAYKSDTIITASDIK